MWYSRIDNAMRTDGRLRPDPPAAAQPPPTTTVLELLPDALDSLDALEPGEAELEDSVWLWVEVEVSV